MLSSSGAWIVDQNTPGNGGGLYRVAIDCDGTLTDLGLKLVADFPTASTWLNTVDHQALIFATAALEASPAVGRSDVRHVCAEPVGAADGEPAIRLPGGISQVGSNTRLLPAPV